MRKKLLSLLLVALQLFAMLSVFAASAATTGLSAEEYLQLDNGKTVWLVLKTNDLAQNQSYTYQGEPMFWSDKYQAFAGLVIADTADGTYAPSASDLATVAGTPTIIEYTGDVNKTGKIDMNDAQVIYNIYTSYYTSFASLSAEKFLRADLNGDKIVDISDALVVISNLGEDPDDIHTCSSMNLVHVAAVAPTCVASGNIEYWYCAEPSCGKKYTSNDCSTEITITLLDPTGIHTGGTATCTAQATCTVCGASYGELADHNSNDYGHNDSDHWTVCDICGGNAGTHVAHTGGTATCTKKAVCTVCGASYGELATHNANGVNYNDDGHWTYCTVCGGNAGEVTAHTGTNSCTDCSWTATGGASYTINGTAMTSFRVYTNSASQSVAISLRKSAKYVLDKTLTLYTSTPSGNAIIVKIDDTLAANQWKYYCEGGKVYILGENITALQTGYMYFISKYLLPDSPPGIVNGDSMTGVAKEGGIVSFNLPSSYESFNVGDGTYTADNIWNTFLAAKNELPSEITVLDHYDPADYPLSGSMQIFVAPNGNDNNDGSINAPVATVDKAISLLSARGIYGGIVWLRGGIYNQYATIESVTGLAESPLFIAAYNGEDVSFTGAYHFSGSAFSALTASDPLYSRIPENARDRVLVADFAALGIDVNDIAEISKTVRPIFAVDGVNQTIARFPNNPGTIQQLSYEDNSGSTSDNRPITLLFDKNVVDFSEWTFTDDMWTYGSVRVDWGFDYRLIASIDTEKNAIVTDSYSHWHTHNDPGALKEYFHFFNFIEALDTYGEWYLDRDTSRFYYIPTSDFTASSELTLIADTRTAGITLTSCSNVVIKGLNIVDMNGYGIYGTYGQDIVVDSCYFENTTSNGAFLISGERVGVIYSEICDLSGQLSADYTAQYTLTPTNNFFQNNYCHGATSARGVSITSGVGNIVSHNRMVDVVFTVAGQNNETIIEYNEMVGGRYGETDTGYIYFPGSNYSIRGNHVRYNHFHDIKTAMTGVYFDMRCSGNYVYGNIIEGNRSVNNVNLVASYGSDNLVYNNVLVHGKTGVETISALDWSSAQNLSIFQTYTASFSKMTDVYKARFPMYVDMVTRMNAIIEELGGTTTPSVSDVSELPADTELFYIGGYSWIKNNVIVDATTPYYDNNYIQGKNTNYVSSGDVGFVDYENGDYRFASGAPITGWEEIPYDKIGLQHTCSSETLTEFEAIEATCGSEGQTKHYRCDCGIYYQNANATGVIADPSTLVIAATGNHTDTTNCLVCGEILDWYTSSGTRRGVYKATPTLDGQMDESYLTKGGCYKFSDITNNYENDDHSAFYVLHDSNYLYVYAKLYDLNPYATPTATVTDMSANASKFQFGVEHSTYGTKREFVVGPGFDYIVSTGTSTFNTSAVSYQISTDNGALFVDEHGSYYGVEIRLSKSEFGIASSGIFKTTYVRYSFNDDFRASGALYTSGWSQCQFWLYNE